MSLGRDSDEKLRSDQEGGDGHNWRPHNREPGPTQGDCGEVDGKPMYCLACRPHLRHTKRMPVTAVW